MSTLLAALSGVLAARGPVTLAGGVPAPAEPHLRARRGVSHLPQRRHLFSSLTVRQNLAPSEAALDGREPVGLDEVLSRFPELASRLDTRVGAAAR